MSDVAIIEHALYDLKSPSSFARTRCWQIFSWNIDLSQNLFYIVKGEDIFFLLDMQKLFPNGFEIA